MKRNFQNIIYITLLCIATIACKKENGPDAKDNFLNYEIPEVPVTDNYVVGAFYQDVPAFNANVTQVPILGKYNMLNGIVPPDIMTKHLQYAATGGLDYFLFSFRSAARDVSGFRRDSAIVSAYLSAATPTSVRFALAYNFSNDVFGISPNALLENDPVKLEQFFNDVEKVAAWMTDAKYMTVNNKKLLYIMNAHNLFSANNPAIYNTLRSRLSTKGVELYIVGMQDRWSPPGRYPFRFQHCVDAIFHQPFLPDGYDRFYLLPQIMDQNWKYSTKYFAEQMGVDYVPNIFPAYDWRIQNPSNQNPTVDRKDNGTLYKKLCNVAKMNASKSTRLILISAFNDWNNDAQLEPAQSYGDLYLNITKTQFKR
ncbi:glycoside hydrolase family 99-like domain-containing protein [Chitinophaga pendula]|uniref:glycoside hydrolase family 99-like domain-containing protein n=1 Tax=Chitinophaga TaxID=79328 RepID=UPI0012FE449C|nr:MULTISPECIES: glycoside hydrolase family 99-like domain-containing protein [Chitinophaga]UCJ05082.1 glycoside hydrolase family 99-like domain-containing protein [Chitinophaga pendula]